jgi:glycosyltransferase involved in cell wall biosynthesis
VRIIHLSYADINGGAFRATYRIHQSLLKQGFHSRMWVNEKKSNDVTVENLNNKTSKALNKLRHRAINYSLVKMLKTKNKIIHSPSVLQSNWVKYINNSDADIVHLHWIQNEMMSIKDISKIKKPIVWTLHDMWAFCGAEHYTNDNRWREGYYPNNRPNYELGFDLNRWTWNRKKKYWKFPIQIVTPSNWLAKCVNESALMKSWPILVIANPIDTDQWTPMNKKKARQLLNLSEDANLILFGAAGGEKDPRKGYDLLLSALELIKAKKIIKKFELVVFGQSEPKSPLDLGFPIHYLGHIDNDHSLRSLYSAADVMAVPSRQDNLPNTAIEAQACGTPVVSFDIGGFPDIINHNINGYLAKPFDTNDLAQGIDWVLNVANYSELCKNARDKALKEFDYKVVAKKYMSLYEKTLIY